MREPLREPMQEHHLVVSRTARYYTLGAANAGTRQRWLVCHGYAQLARAALRGCSVLDDGTRLIAAPEGLSRFYLDESVGMSHAGGVGETGASWMTREDRLYEIEDQFRYLEDVCADAFAGAPSTAPLTALGFSQGAAAIARWAARTANHPARVILWGGSLPDDMPDGTARALAAATELVLVVGSRDALVSSERVLQEEERLRGLGIAFRSLRFDGGHRLDDATLLELAGG